MSKLLTSLFDKVDDNHQNMLFDDPDFQKPYTIISLNSLGKVRKMGLKSPENRKSFMSFYILFFWLGKLCYWLTQKVSLSDDYIKYDTK